MQRENVSAILVIGMMFSFKHGEVLSEVAIRYHRNRFSPFPTKNNFYLPFTSKNSVNLTSKLFGDLSLLCEKGTKIVD